MPFELIGKTTLEMISFLNSRSQWYIRLPWMEKRVWLAKIVPTGKAEPWTPVVRIRFGESKPTKNVIYHWSDWTFVLSTAPAQKPCGPYWFAVGIKVRTMR